MNAIDESAARLTSCHNLPVTIRRGVWPRLETAHSIFGPSFGRQKGSEVGILKLGVLGLYFAWERRRWVYGNAFCGVLRENYCSLLPYSFGASHIALFDSNWINDHEIRHPSSFKTER